jgi:type I restriction enzyme S subunit
MTKFAQPKLEELMVKRRGSVDPSKFPVETFELFSIPAFDTGEAVVISGSEIGSSKQNVEPGDLLLSKIVPHIRRAWVVTPLKGYRQIASGEWMIFKHSDAFPDYLRHLLTSDWFHPKLMNTVAGVGGSLVRARPSEIARIEIPLPPLAEQKRIAAILDKADAIRRKLQQSLRLSDDFLRSVFLDMFGSDKSPKCERDPLGPFLEFMTSGGRGWSQYYAPSGARFIPKSEVEFILG